MVDRGTDSINSLLSYIIFNIAPTLADIGMKPALL
jgi:ABC-type transport system involved in Fe-S cluster assembly fused permease/ATPase subunit